MNYTKTQKITITAIFTAISIVIAIFSIPINLGGATTMVITFASPFLIMIGILFGPIYAGIAYLCNDIISHIIKPLGPYMWEYALLLIFKGASVGFLYKAIREVNINLYKKIFLYGNRIGLGLAILGLASLFISSVNQNLYILICISIIFICTLNLITYYVLNKNYNYLLSDYLKINFSVALPYIISTVIATFIFKKYYGLTRETAFIVLTPRVLEEIFVVIIYSIVCCIFLQIFKNYINKGENI